MQSLFTLRDFYSKLSLPIPDNIGKDVGHFNVFKIDEYRTQLDKGEMRYDQRSYFKISLINGRNKAEYADKSIHIEDKALLFASPKIPYRYVPLLFLNGRLLSLKSVDCFWLFVDRHLQF